MTKTKEVLNEIEVEILISTTTMSLEFLNELMKTIESSLSHKDAKVSLGSIDTRTSATSERNFRSQSRRYFLDYKPRY